jgi:hypothetical protein
MIVSAKITSEKAFPLAHVLSSAIVHAYGLLDNSFAVIMCANHDTLALPYLRRIDHPIGLQKPVTGVTRTISPATDDGANSLINHPAWKSTPTINHILSADANKVYFEKLDAIFKIEKPLDLGHTEFKRPGATPRQAATPAPAVQQPKGKKGNKLTQDNSKAPAKKDTPSKAKETGDKSSARPKSAPAKRGGKR